MSMWGAKGAFGDPVTRICEHIRVLIYLQAVMMAASLALAVTLLAKAGG